MKKRMRVTWVHVFARIKNTKDAFKNPTCSILFEANKWLAVHTPFTSPTHAIAAHPCQLHASIHAASTTPRQLQPFPIHPLLSWTHIS